MITWLIWTPMSSVIKKADKLNLSFSLCTIDEIFTYLFLRVQETVIQFKMDARNELFTW